MRSRHHHVPIGQRFYRVLAILFFAFAMLASPALHVPEAVAQTLSPKAKARLQQHIRALQAGDDVQPVHERFAGPLGLKQPFTRKNAVWHRDDGTAYGLSVGVSDPTRLIFFRQSKTEVRLFSATLDGELLSAAVSRNNVVAPEPIEAVRAEFAAVLRFFTEVAQTVK